MLATEKKWNSTEAAQSQGCPRPAAPPHLGPAQGPGWHRDANTTRDEALGQPGHPQARLAEGWASVGAGRTRLFPAWLGRAREPTGQTAHPETWQSPRWLSSSPGLALEQQPRPCLPSPHAPPTACANPRPPGLMAPRPPPTLVLQATAPAHPTPQFTTDPEDLPAPASKPWSLRLVFNA